VWKAGIAFWCGGLRWPSGVEGCGGLLVSSVECRVSSVECRVSSVECRVSSVECRDAVASPPRLGPPAAASATRFRISVWSADSHAVPGPRPSHHTTARARARPPQSVQHGLRRSSVERHRHRLLQLQAQDHKRPGLLVCTAPSAKTCHMLTTSSRNEHNVSGFCSRQFCPLVRPGPPRHPASRSQLTRLRRPTRDTLPSEPTPRPRTCTSTSRKQNGRVRACISIC
jgi:hypothetical protein